VGSVGGVSVARWVCVNLDINRRVSADGGEKHRRESRVSVSSGVKLSLLAKNERWVSAISH
jgi:hypothetical protein